MRLVLLQSEICFPKSEISAAVPEDIFYILLELDNFLNAWSTSIKSIVLPCKSGSILVIVPSLLLVRHWVHDNLVQ